MRRYVIIGLVLLLAALISQVAYAQGPATPPPPPVVTTPVPPVNPVDAANARADQWQTVANQAMQNAQSAINQAYSSLYAAQASVAQYQAAFQQAEAARIAAQQGQLQAASEASHAAQLAAIQAIALASEAGQSALTSIQQSGEALRAIPELRANLTTVTTQRDRAQAEAAQLDKDRVALGTALVMERQRSDLLAKVATGLFLLLGLLMSYIVVVLLKIMRIFNHKSANDRLVILDERGRVKAQIEALR